MLATSGGHPLPITYAEQVKAPVLVIQGRNDSRTTARQIELYEAKMRTLGKDIELDWFDAVLGLTEAALRHAERCLALTHEHAGLMEDFDRAFAYEGIARAHAIAGQREAAREHLREAEAAGQTIRDQEDRDIFFAELNRGPWNGVR